MRRNGILLMIALVGIAAGRLEAAVSTQSNGAERTGSVSFRLPYQRVSDLTFASGEEWLAFQLGGQWPVCGSDVWARAGRQRLMDLVEFGNQARIGGEMSFEPMSGMEAIGSPTSGTMLALGPQILGQNGEEKVFEPTRRVLPAPLAFVTFLLLTVGMAAADGGKNWWQGWWQNWDVPPAVSVNDRIPPRELPTGVPTSETVGRIAGDASLANATTSGVRAEILSRTKGVRPRAVRARSRRASA